MWNAILLIAAFLLGTIPTGLLIVRRVRGIDIRTTGSGNIGATNVVRTAGWGWGLFTLFLDAIKGACVPAVMALLDPAGGVVLLRWQMAASASVLAGNIFNPFLGFRGGKGVGTAIGVTAVLAPVPFVCGLTAFAILYGITRIVSVGSLTAGFVFGAAAAVIYGAAASRPPVEWLLFCLVVSLLVFLTHRSNLRRLLSGKETRLTRSE